MGTHKYQTRYVVPYEGELKRIISSRERSDGAINITTHLHGLTNIASPTDPKTIEESRFSVHMSKASVASENTIHGTTQHADGTKTETHLVTNAVATGRLQLITMRTVVHPRFLPTLELPAKPSIAKLPSYNPERCTMAYQIWVCSPEVGENRELIMGPYVPVRRFYRRFTLFIPIAYLRIPSSEFGRTFDQFTTTPEKQTSELKKTGGPVGPTDGESIRSITGHVVWNFNQILKVRQRAGFTFEQPKTMSIIYPDYSPTPVS